MIITQRKPLEELLAMLEGAKTVALVGCGSCATACATGGEREVAELKAILESRGMRVCATAMCDYCCVHLKARTALRPVIAQKPDAVVAMCCGDGTQVIAQYCQCPVYPSNNTMFLGESIRVGLYEEACRMCGDCLLGRTGGICPITRCAKSLVNGPCGGSRDGRCEVNPDNPCAWIEIYNRLTALGQADKLGLTRDDKDYDRAAYPRTIDNRRKQS